MNDLQKMLDTQANFEKRVGYNIPEMTTEEKTAYIKEYSLHLINELGEMLHELPFFKPWKNYSDMTVEEVEDQQDKGRGEFIDAWHFMLNIALALDFTGEELAAAYYEKHQINNERQDNGYKFIAAD